MNSFSSECIVYGKWLCDIYFHIENSFMILFNANRSYSDSCNFIINIKRNEI